MKKLILLTIISFVIFSSGCWVKVSEEREGTPISKQEQEEIIPEHLQCFQRFKKACEQEDWQRAYQELSSEWRSHKTLEQFKANMEQGGAENLIDSRVSTVVKIYQNNEEKWALTINNEKYRTLVLLINESGVWKIQGAKDLTN